MEFYLKVGVMILQSQLPPTGKHWEGDFCFVVIREVETEQVMEVSHEWFFISC